MMSMRKAAMVGVLVLIVVVVYSFAAGNFNPANSSNPSKNDSGSINSINSLTDSGDSPLPTRMPIPVDFSVNGSSYQIVFAVNVDLNDGMAKEEAVLVAQQLFVQVHPKATCELKSAEGNPEGVWTVSLPWGAVYADGSQESYGHFFNAKIDPATQTVEYSTCF